MKYTIEEYKSWYVVSKKFFFLDSQVLLNGEYLLDSIKQCEEAILNDCSNIKSIKEESKESGKVKCETCKHWVDKVDAQKIVDKFWGSFGLNETNLFYCPMHKVPYDVIWQTNLGKKSYFSSAEREVDEKGKEIKK